MMITIPYMDGIRNGHQTFFLHISHDSAMSKAMKGHRNLFEAISTSISTKVWDPLNHCHTCQSYNQGCYNLPYVGPLPQETFMFDPWTISLNVYIWVVPQIGVGPANHQF